MDSIALKELAQATINTEASPASPIDEAIVTACRSYLNG